MQIEREAGMSREPGTTGPGMTSMREENGSQMADQATAAASRAAEQAKQAGEQVEARADAGMDRAASGLETAAEQVRGRLSGDGEGVRGAVGVKVADGLDRASGYLREHESREVWDDLETYVRDHPTQALIGAVAAGFVISKVLR